MSTALQLNGRRRIADVGADHGYLSIWLIKTGRADRIIAIENPAGPLGALMSSVNNYRLQDAIEVRCGDGLQVVQPGEIDACVIAGMGGGTIAGILARSPEVVASISAIVCQPMTDAFHLRRWLYESGWGIKDEDLVEEDGRIYEIIRAEPGLDVLLDSILLEIGPRLWERRHPLLKENLARQLFRMESVIASLKKSKSEAAVQKRLEFETHYNSIKERWKCL